MKKSLKIINDDNSPGRFEDSFPEEAAGLMEIYSNSPKFSCPHGHKHYFNFINVTSKNLQVIPLRYCAG